METQLGNKETKEAVVALNELTLAFIESFKGGINVAGVVELWEILQKDDDLKTKIKDAYDNYQLIPSEVADMDLLESLDLVSVQLEYFKKIATALKPETVPVPEPLPEPTPTPEEPVPAPEPTPEPVPVPEEPTEAPESVETTQN